VPAPSPTKVSLQRLVVFARHTPVRPAERQSPAERAVRRALERVSADDPAFWPLVEGELAIALLTATEQQS
jgi:hypothetical protein